MCPPGALELQANDRKVEHEVTKQGRLEWRRLVGEGGTTQWGGHRHTGVHGERVVGERKGGDK